MTTPKALVNIIVIGYNLPKLEGKCLTSIVTNTNWPYLLTYFDNYKSGLSLTQVWNKLVSASPSPYICLLNNDTEVYPDWLSFMMDCFVTPKGLKIGLVGPSTNSARSIQTRIPSFAAAKGRPGSMVQMKDHLCGFCLLFKKQLWKDLKGFDEKFMLYGQETDFITRAKELGYTNVWRQDAFVFHYGEASCKSSRINIDAARAYGRKLYNKKHNIKT